MSGVGEAAMRLLRHASNIPDYLTVAGPGPWLRKLDAAVLGVREALNDDAEEYLSRVPLCDLPESIAALSGDVAFGPPRSWGAVSDARVGCTNGHALLLVAAHTRVVQPHLRDGQEVDLGKVERMSSRHLVGRMKSGALRAAVLAADDAQRAQTDSAEAQPVVLRIGPAVLNPQALRPWVTAPSRLFPDDDVDIHATSAEEGVRLVAPRWTAVVMPMRPGDWKNVVHLGMEAV